MTPGMSFVLCCHNSARRLPETLGHLAAQRVPPATAWEVLLVDNASTDDTADAARRTWGEGPAPLRIVEEPKLGLTSARLAGIHAARFEAVTLVDDDNWLSPDWLTVALDSLRANPLVGAIGGQSHAEPEIDAPAWFSTFAGDYAVGQQSKRTADVTKSRGYLWGAGLVIRREAWTDLLEAGFEFVLDDRAGTRTGSGGDSEICLGLRLRGWQLLYDSQLNFDHYLPRGRLRWRYLRKLYRGFGQASIVLDTYRLVLRERDDLDIVEEEFGWSFRMRSALRVLCRSPVSLGSALVTASEGSPQALAMEYEMGRASALWLLRHELDRITSSIRRLAMQPLSSYTVLNCLEPPGSKVDIASRFASVDSALRETIALTKVRTPPWGPESGLIVNELLPGLVLEKGGSPTFLWLGCGKAEGLALRLRSTARQFIELHLVASPGPSRDDRRRTMSFRLRLSGGREQHVDLAFEREQRLSWRFELEPGCHTLEISVPEPATVKALPNGDKRHLLAIIGDVQLVPPSPSRVD